MTFLQVATILVTGLIAGIELTVSAFINPALWKLDDRALTRELAKSLGRAMPFAYFLGLILLCVEAWLFRHTPHRMLFFWAAGIWAATILYTVTLLVPINNRIARNMIEGAVWREQHKRWDTLHRLRIGMLVASIVCFLLGLLG